MSSQPGRLIMAGNSLGDPRDIPTRALAALRSADLVVFEEARQGRQSLKAAGLHREFLLLSEHRQQATLDAVRLALENSQTVVYMSDQGMPGIADPGQELVAIARQLGAKLQIIPGASSITAALAACPFAVDEFFMAGFLPRDENERLRKLRELTKRQQTLVILDTPYRLKQILSACAHVIGERQALLALDISGEHEDYLYGRASELLRQVETLEKKLNFVLVISP